MPIRFQRQGVQDSETGVVMQISVGQVEHQAQEAEGEEEEEVESKTAEEEDLPVQEVPMEVGTDFFNVVVSVFIVLSCYCYWSFLSRLKKT
jgi:hypothetical protein